MFPIFDIFVIFGLKVCFLGLGRGLKRLVEVLRFVVTEYRGVGSHGDLIRNQNCINQKKYKGPTIMLPPELIILPEGLLFRAPFSEPYMLGYFAPYMESSISPSTNMEAAFGRLHNSGGW